MEELNIQLAQLMRHAQHFHEKQPKYSYQKLLARLEQIDSSFDRLELVESLTGMVSNTFDSKIETLQQTLKIKPAESSFHQDHVQKIVRKVVGSQEFIKFRQQLKRNMEESIENLSSQTEPLNSARRSQYQNPWTQKNDQSWFGYSIGLSHSFAAASMDASEVERVTEVLLDGASNLATKLRILRDLSLYPSNEIEASKSWPDLREALEALILYDPNNAVFEECLRFMVKMVNMETPALAYDTLIYFIRNLKLETGVKSMEAEQFLDESEVSNSPLSAKFINIVAVVGVRHMKKFWLLIQLLHRLPDYWLRHDFKFVQNCIEEIVNFFAMSAQLKNSCFNPFVLLSLTEICHENWFSHWMNCQFGRKYLTDVLVTYPKFLKYIFNVVRGYIPKRSVSAAFQDQDEVGIFLASKLKLLLQEQCCNFVLTLALYTQAYNCFEVVNENTQDILMHLLNLGLTEFYTVSKKSTLSDMVVNKLLVQFFNRIDHGRPLDEYVINVDSILNWLLNLIRVPLLTDTDGYESMSVCKKLLNWPIFRHKFVNKRLEMNGFCGTGPELLVESLLKSLQTFDSSVNPKLGIPSQISTILSIFNDIISEMSRSELTNIISDDRKHLLARVMCERNLLGYDVFVPILLLSDLTYFSEDHHVVIASTIGLINYCNLNLLTLMQLIKYLRSTTKRDNRTSRYILGQYGHMIPEDYWKQYLISLDFNECQKSIPVLCGRSIFKRLAKPLLSLIDEFDLLDYSTRMVICQILLLVSKNQLIIAQICTSGCTTLESLVNKLTKTCSESDTSAEVLELAMEQASFVASETDIPTQSVNLSEMSTKIIQFCLNSTTIAGPLEFMLDIDSWQYMPLSFNEIEVLVTDKFNGEKSRFLVKPVVAADVNTKLETVESVAGLMKIVLENIGSKVRLPYVDILMKLTEMKSESFFSSSKAKHSSQLHQYSSVTYAFRKYVSRLQLVPDKDMKDSWTKLLVEFGLNDNVENCGSVLLSGIILAMCQCQLQLSCDVFRLLSEWLINFDAFDKVIIKLEIIVPEFNGFIRYIGHDVETILHVMLDQCFLNYLNWPEVCNFLLFIAVGGEESLINYFCLYCLHIWQQILANNNNNNNNNDNNNYNNNDCDYESILYFCQSDKLRPFKLCHFLSELQKL